MLTGVTLISKYQEEMTGYLSCIEADQIVMLQVVIIFLRNKGVPVTLKLSLEEWKTFRPLAVLVE